MGSSTHESCSNLGTSGFLQEVQEGKEQGGWTSKRQPTCITFAHKADIQSYSG